MIIEKKQNRFSYDLIKWYEKEHRELPWRKTKEPYKIWLSEVIMQQTRIDQGMAYYFKFLKLFPTIQKLAEASENEVLNAWQGLGYYSRGRNLHHTAIVITRDLDGEFPSNYKDLLMLKGIGPYTASAISSICFNEKQAVVDGNVERFISRYFGVHDAVNQAKGKQAISKIADKLILKEYPGDHNQAMMEMGATVCTPKKPKCESCTFSSSCYALANDLIGRLPVKVKNIKVVDREIDYVVCQYKDEIFMKKRTDKDIWFGLFDFPGSMKNKEDYDEQLGKENYSFLGDPIHMKHILSHQRLYVSFQRISIKNKKGVLFEGSWQDPMGILDTPMPRLIEKYLVENHSELVDQKI